MKVRIEYDESMLPFTGAKVFLGDDETEAPQLAEYEIRHTAGRPPSCRLVVHAHDGFDIALPSADVSLEVIVHEGMELVEEDLGDGVKRWRARRGE